MATERDFLVSIDSPQIQRMSTVYTTCAWKRPTTLTTKIIKLEHILSPITHIQHFINPKERADVLKAMWQHVMETVNTRTDYLQEASKGTYTYAKDEEKSNFIKDMFKKPKAPQKHVNAKEASKSSYVEEMSKATLDWSIARYTHLLALLKRQRTPPSILGPLIESLNWVFLAQIAHENDDDSEIADQEVWRRYAVNVKGLDTVMPRHEFDFNDTMGPIRQEAREHFVIAIENSVFAVHEKELLLALAQILRLPDPTQFFLFIFPKIVERLNDDYIKTQIFPIFLLICSVQKDDTIRSLLMIIFDKYLHFITSEVANSMLEFSAHVTTSNTAQLILNSLGHLISVEGMVVALISAATRGHDSLLALLQLRVQEKIEHEQAVGHTSAWDLSDTLSFTCFVAPFIYPILGVAAHAGLVRSTVMVNLISFFCDFESILDSVINVQTNKIFTKKLFNMTCRLNHWNILQPLIECEWAPPNVIDEIMESIKFGHQKVLHILLDSLLAPDTKIETKAGVVPKIFRLDDILRALPMVARRFPTEIAWFLDELSNVPIPICVPQTQETEPSVRSMLVRGLKLGHASLSDVTKLDASLPHQHVTMH